MKRTSAFLSATALLLAACSSPEIAAPTASDVSARAASGTTTTVPTTARIQACKFALDTETIGKTFSFTFSAAQPGTLLSAFSLTAAQSACEPSTATTIWASETVTATDLEITEKPQAGAVLVYWRHVDENGVENDVFPGNPSFTSATGTSYEAPAGTTKLIVKNAKGGTIYAKNRSVPVNIGGKGCTPGYWFRPQHFDSWPAQYQPGTAFASVFGFAPTGVTSLLTGGTIKGNQEGYEALTRHATAALLNASVLGVDYKYTVAEVIELYQTAMGPNGDREGTKNLLAIENEQGCPLN